MTMLRTLLASLLISVAGITTLGMVTDGFQAFTSATALRFEIREHPRVVPNARLQTANGRLTDFAALRGRWLLVDFIYTRCLLTCSVQGNQFTSLQERLAGPIAQNKVTLLSISFDPAHDGPTQLADYQSRSGGAGKGWLAVRPTDGQELTALMRVFGIKSVPDGLGGFVHNPVIGVVDPQGRLVAVLNWDDPDEAVHFVTKRLGL